jgi:hypothetical protein
MGGSEAPSLNTAEQISVQTGKTTFEEMGIPAPQPERSTYQSGMGFFKPKKPRDRRPLLY